MSTSEAHPTVLCYFGNITQWDEKMSVGASGRIAIEIDPAIKRELYTALSRDDETLKGWFLTRAEEYICGSGQLSIFERDHDSDAESSNRIKG